MLPNDQVLDWAHVLRQVPGRLGRMGEAERGVPQGVEQGGAAHAQGDCAHRGHLRLAHGPVG